MFIVKYYLTASVASLIIAMLLSPWYLTFLFIWISLSLFAVSLAYIFDAPSIFRKRADGSIPSYIMLLLLPFFSGVQLYNHWARRNDSVPAIQEITPKLFLACRLFPSDIAQLKSRGVSAIVDATSEFSGLDWSARDNALDYINIPILDHSAPQKEALIKAVNWISHQINNNRGVIVHCALGRGRSVLIVAAYLLASGHFNSVDETLKFINKIRGTANLNKRQYQKLALMHEENIWPKQEPILLIINPVSGGGSWLLKKETIEQLLSVKYKLDFKLTSETLSAKHLTSTHKNKGYKMIVACGGDGTVNEVASELIGTNIPMAIIPLGTTNALAHVLIGNQSKIKPIESACNDIIMAKSTLIDTATCNDDILLLVAGLGFQEKMISSADRKNKNEGGEFAYIEGLTSAIKQNESTCYQISFDGNAAEEVSATSIVVANAAPFTTILAQGGQEPDPTDGLLDITILDTQQSITLPILSLLTKGLTRQWQDSIVIDGVKTRQAKTIEIKQASTIDYVIDGEVRKSEQVSITVNEKSLRVVHWQQINDKQEKCTQ